MITFKIIDYDLYSGQWRWTRDADTKTGKYEARPLVHGQKVCSSQKLETMGVVTNIGEETDVITPYKNQSDQTIRAYSKEVTVLWLTGPKKGKSEIKSTRNLSDFTAYKEAVLNHLREVEKIEEEGAKTGL